jgi:hypothetical protein
MPDPIPDLTTDPIPDLTTDPIPDLTTDPTGEPGARSCRLCRAA